MNARTVLDIAHGPTPSAPSPEHKRLQSLLDKIDEARLRLQAWHEQLPQFAQRHTQRADPVQARLAALRRAWAFELEQLLLLGKWSKTDQQTLAEMACELAGRLLQQQGLDGHDDAELKALYNRVADVEWDTRNQRHAQAMQSAVEDRAGLGADEDTGNNAGEPIDDAARHPDTRTHTRKPGKARSAAQKRAEADATSVSQTVRDVYRKLASALHPDRAEPGATPALQAERTERTERMARANAAYAAGDLLALLTLQLEIEQVSVAHAAAVTASQVRHFNALLTAQLAELQVEIDDRQNAFCASYGLFTEQRLDPLKLGVLLQDKLQMLLAQEVLLKTRQRQLRGDAATARHCLKQWREQARLDELFA